MQFSSRERVLTSFEQYCNIIIRLLENNAPQVQDITKALLSTHPANLPPQETKKVLRSYLSVPTTILNLQNFQQVFNIQLCSHILRLSFYYSNCLKKNKNYSVTPINLFSLYVLFSQYRSCDNTLENCLLLILSYLRASTHN